MEQQLRKQLSAMFLDADAGDPGIRYLQAEQMLKRYIQYMRDGHANHTGMGNNQHMLSSMVFKQAVPGRNNPVTKCRKRFGARWRMRHRIMAESIESFRIRRSQLVGSTPFPRTKTQLDQACIDVQRQLVTLGQFPGKIRAT